VNLVAVSTSRSSADAVVKGPARLLVSIYHLDFGNEKCRPKATELQTGHSCPTKTLMRLLGQFGIRCVGG
jgi:hypothetical protein